MVFGKVENVFRFISFLTMKVLQISTRSAVWSRWQCSSAMWLSLCWDTVERRNVLSRLRHVKLRSAARLLYNLWPAKWDTVARSSQLLAASSTRLRCLWTSARFIVRQTTEDSGGGIFHTLNTVPFLNCLIESVSLDALYILSLQTYILLFKQRCVTNLYRYYKCDYTTTIEQATSKD